MALPGHILPNELFYFQSPGQPLLQLWLQLPCYMHSQHTPRHTLLLRPLSELSIMPYPLSMPLVRYQSEIYCNVLVSVYASLLVRCPELRGVSYSGVQTIILVIDIGRLAGAKAICPVSAIWSVRYKKFPCIVLMLLCLASGSCCTQLQTNIMYVHYKVLLRKLESNCYVTCS